MKTRIVVLGGEKLSALMQLQGGDAIEVKISLSRYLQGKAVCGAYTAILELFVTVI